MKKLLLLLTIITISLAASCHKEEETPNLHETVRFKLNGIEWKTYNYRTEDFLGASRSWDLQYYPNLHKTIEMTAALKLRDGSKNESIHLITKYDTIGNHKLFFLRKQFIDWNRPGNCGFYNLDTSAIRRITILELDTVEQVMVGTFEFSVIDPLCGDTLHITDGYFDLIYR